MAITTKDIIRKFQEEVTAYLEVNLRKKLQMLEDEGLLECLAIPEELTQHDITITLDIKSELKDKFISALPKEYITPCLGEPDFKVKHNRITFNINY